MTEHPTSWRVTTLGAVANYWNGRAFKKSEWREAGRGRPIIRIQDLTGSRGTPNYFDGEVDDRHIARSGDILVSWAATLGVFVWNGPDAVINQHIFKVEPLVDRRFLRYLLEAVLDDLRRRSHGTGIVHVTRKAFDDTPVALPPDTEQQRIVDVIEEQFSRLDDAEASLRKARHSLYAMRASVLATVGAPEWTRKRIGDVFNVSVGTTPSRSNAALWNGGIPWVSSGEVAFCRITATRETISAAATTPDRVHPPGTVLLAMIGEGKTRGQAAVLDVAAAHNQNSAAIRVDHGVALPEWVYYVLMQRYAVTRQAGSGNNQPALNKSRVQEIEIPLPPVEEQHRIVGEIESRLSIIEAIEATIKHSITRVNLIRRSILEQAFSGRLVPQDPDDEPASNLPARVASAHATTNHPRRRIQV